MSNPEKSPTTPEQRANNRRLGLILATIALVFFLGVIFKRVVFGS
ncbi:cytochrome oxidase small assembly protein [Ralstonia sp. UBA689]|nr:cytochrome oxidase small assembly protein [Ralstonia sp. UBA689]